MAWWNLIVGYFSTFWWKAPPRASGNLFKLLHYEWLWQIVVWIMMKSFHTPFFPLLLLIQYNRQSNKKAISCYGTANAIRISIFIGAATMVATILQLRRFSASCHLCHLRHLCHLCQLRLLVIARSVFRRRPFPARQRKGYRNQIQNIILLVYSKYLLGSDEE